MGKLKKNAEEREKERRRKKEEVSERHKMVSGSLALLYLVLE